MKLDDYLKFKKVLELYDEKTKLIETKKVFVAMLDSCKFSKYDSAFVLFSGNVASNNSKTFSFQLNDDCLNILIIQTNIEISTLQQELENIKLEDL